MLKSMKKLKFWSRKKKKRERKTHHLPLPYYSPPPSRPPPPPPPPPQTHHSCCSCYRATEPSAPPLPPPWFTSDHYPAAGDTPLAPEFDEYPALPGESSWSYQQYTVPNPAYGIPVGPERAAETERSGRPPCWLLDLGIRLLGCFFPCYRIKDL